MPTVPVRIIGPSYEHRSLTLSAQSCKNIYPEVVPSASTPVALLPWPGLKNFAASVSQVDRGMHVANNVLYQVYGGTLCSVDSSGNRITLGTISGSGQCVMEDDGNYLVIATGGSRYTYNFSTGTLATISDSDHENGNSVAYINSQMIYDGTGQRYAVADAGDPTSINSLNYASAEAYPDDLERVLTKDQLLYLFCEKSFEAWYNSGSGNPPFDRVQNGVRPVGISGPHAVAATKDYIYFCSNDHQVYRVRQFQEQQITPPAIANAFESYTVSDVRAYSLIIEGQWFIIFRFLTSGKSWMFCETADAWVELTTDNLETIYTGNSYAYAYNKHLIADETTGEIWELDLNTFTHDGTEVIRERITAPISAVDLEQPGKRLIMSRFELIMETGVGLATGQGSNPTVMFSASFDGGKTYTNEDTVEIGRTGEGRIKVEWYHMESFYNAVIKIRISDPVFFTIHAASIDVEFDGDY